MTMKGDGNGLVFIARHGETAWNREGRWQGRTDIPLSDVGRAQARALADRLRVFAVARVHASHLRRAHETAEIVAAALGLPPPIVDPDLCERSFGCFEGLTGEECAERHPDLWSRYRLDRRDVPPGAEGQALVVERMVRGLSAAAAGVSVDAPALVVSHGGAMRAFIGAATGVVPPPLPNGALFRATVAGGRFVAFDLVGD